MSYMNNLTTVAERDVDELKQKDAEYGSSWKKRGGVGAFMMLARKWDRIETQCRPYQYDIFQAVQKDGRTPNGLADDIGDLRRYLMLVEAELLEQGIID